MQICSTNTFIFNELRQVNPQYAEKVDTFRSLFEGKPEKVLVLVEGEEGGDPVPPIEDTQN